MPPPFCDKHKHKTVGSAGSGRCRAAAGDTLAAPERAIRGAVGETPLRWNGTLINAASGDVGIWRRRRDRRTIVA
jgi:hypothetical protein